MRSDLFHVVGAFDRFNYGDVLFAHISEYVIRSAVPDAEIRFYGTHASDLRPEGGVRTGTLRDLYRAKTAQPSVIWVAGGEVLGSRWFAMSEHALSSDMAKMSRRVRRRIGLEWPDRFFHLLSATPNLLPWVFDPDDLLAATGTRPRVVYNSVGGLNAGQVPGRVGAWQTQSLAKADWLAVRDTGTQAVLARMMGKAPRLSPDSAVLMAELPAAADLGRLRADLMARMGLSADKPYVCVQCGMNYLEAGEEALAAQLERIAVDRDVQVVAFAIGRAAGHEDQMTARRLADCLPARPWFRLAPEDLTVWEIMALISGSGCYVGTSLHGYITAFAFARPRVGLSPKVTKQIGFRNDWDVPTMPAGVAFGDLAAAVDAAMAHSEPQMRQQADQVVARYRADLEDLWRPLGHHA